MKRIFISYRRQDSQHQADRLHAHLKQAVQDPDEQIFIDVDNIPLGVDFFVHLDSKVGQCDVLLALIGPGWLDARDPVANVRRLDDPADFVRIEIASALKRGVPVVPVLLDGTPPPHPKDLPEDLRPLVRRQAVEVRRMSFDADAERLVRGLRLDPVAKAAAPVRKSAAPPVRWPTWAVSVAVVLAVVVAGVVLLGVIDALGRREASEGSSADETGAISTPPVIVERLDYNQQPSYGDVSLTAGFPSDPHTIDLTSGGPIDVAYLNEQQCAGFASIAPSYRVQWTGETAALRIFFVAADSAPDRDTTLLVNNPGGVWTCNDDAGEGSGDPLVVFENPAPGRYEIWVGNYNAGQTTSGTLYVTERDLAPGSIR